MILKVYKCLILRGGYYKRRKIGLLILWKLVTFLCDLPYNMAIKAITKRVVAKHAIVREEPKR